MEVIWVEMCSMMWMARLHVAVVVGTIGENVQLVVVVVVDDDDDEG